MDEGPFSASLRARSQIDRLLSHMPIGESSQRWKHFRFEDCVQSLYGVLERFIPVSGTSSQGVLLCMSLHDAQIQLWLLEEEPTIVVIQGGATAASSIKRASEPTGTGNARMFQMDGGMLRLV